MLQITFLINIFISKISVIVHRIELIITSTNNRIVGLDGLRGIAIIFMAFFHNFEFYSGNLDNYAASVANNPIALVIKFLGRWAGLFFIISGFAHGYSSYLKFKEKKINSKQLMGDSIIQGFWLILFGKVINFFFARTSRGGGIYAFNQGPLHYSILGSLFETGHIHLPDIYSTFFSMGALGLMGLALIIYSAILAMLFSKEGYKHKERNLIIIGGIAIFILLISPEVITTMRPLWVNALETKKYFTAFWIGLLVADTHPLMPFLGYAFFGVFFGIAFAMDVPHKFIFILGLAIGSLFAFSGFIGYILHGEPPIEDIIQTLTQRTMNLQIGLMIIIISVMYKLEKIKKVSHKNQGGSSFIVRFGKGSLTVFLLEGFVATVVKVIFLDSLIPTWSSHMFWIVVFSFSQLFLLSILLKNWEKVNMKGSFEWLTGAILQTWRKKTRKCTNLPISQESAEPN